MMYESSSRVSCPLCGGAEFFDFYSRDSVPVTCCSAFEDAAQAHGASLHGTPVGAFGSFAMFSLYPTKNMTSGEGGMVAVDTDEIERLSRLNIGTWVKTDPEHFVKIELYQVSGRRLRPDGQVE